MAEAGFETLIADDLVAIISEETGVGTGAAQAAADRILALESVRDAFAAWWREESYSNIFDGDG